MASRATHGEVIIRHPKTDALVHLPLAESSFGVSVAVLGTFPTKQLIGDANRSNHTVLSELIMSDWSGGVGVDNVNEATDATRCWWSTVETLHPHAVALRRLSRKYVGTGGVCRVLGDFGDVLRVAWGKRLAGVQITSAGAVTDTTTATLAFEPVGPGVTFAGTGGVNRFFIPLGANGYQVLTAGGALGTTITDIKPVAFCRFRNKLYALGTDGRVSYTLTGDAAGWTTQATLDASYAPRNILEFYDGQNNPMLHVVSDERVFAFVPETGELEPTQAKYPPHPHHALASAVWRTDLYVSVGIGGNRYTGGTYTGDSGLDRDDGAPKEFSSAGARFVAFADTQNYLIGLLQGSRVAGTDGAMIVSDVDPHDPVFASGSAQSALMAWNGEGWHPLWVATSATAEPTGMLLSTANDAYRVCWALEDGTLWWQDLPIQFHNAKQRTTEHFEPEGYLEVGNLDFGMTGADKLLMAIEVRSRDCTATERIVMEYAINDGAWTTLGEVTDSTSVARMRFGITRPHDDGRLRFKGAVAERIRLRAWLYRGADDTKTPILESIGIVYQKVADTLVSYRFQVDCSMEDHGTYKGMSNEGLQDFLESLLGLGANELLAFCHRKRWRNVRVSGVSGQDRTGEDLRGNREVTLLEVYEDGV